MLTSRSSPAVGLVAQMALLAALGTTVGLSPLGWAVGLACGVVTNAAVVVGLARSGTDTLGVADLVTLTRATLACGVAALVADSFLGQPAVPTLVALAVVALALDAVDGWVARRTRTVSVFGARFDGEADAFLMLVLSVYVARSAGGWVLAIGAARYAFALAGWAMPWLRAPLPPRYWRKVVAGIQGVVLILAAAQVLPPAVTYGALAVALVLLAESFGRDVWWLWDLRRTQLAQGQSPQVRTRRGRAVVATLADVLALMVVWFALVAPTEVASLTPGDLLRLPVEGIIVAGLALVLPSWARRTMAVGVGVLLGLLTLVKALDVAFLAAFDRPFDLVTDRSYLGPAIELVGDAIGSASGVVILVAAGGFVAAVLVGLPLAVTRLAGLVARHRGPSARIVTGLGVTWAVLAVSGFHIGPAAPVASTSASRVAVDHVGAIPAGIRDEQRFEAAVAVDRFRGADRRELLAGLQGKDVLLTFVESYGRSAVEGLPSSSRIRGLLDTGSRRLRASGYSSQSAYLTSPTFGGLSWLAHATLQAGLWVDNEQRHDRLLSGDRTTLTRAFDRAGWKTVAVMPSNKESWPEGKAFYGFDVMFDGKDIGYRGPKFGWSAMPDQYALSAFQRLVLSPRHRPPVMAEIALTSSHPPWAPLPRMVGWRDIGDGTVYDRIHRRAVSTQELWRHPENVEAAYAQSIAYSLNTVISFVEEYGDEDLVLILVGDHQPAAVVTGNGASHDVPITVVAHDPAVIDALSGWGWQDGMRPGTRSPVWPMDAFRDRFLAAYSRPLPPTPSASALHVSRHLLER